MNRKYLAISLAVLGCANTLLADTISPSSYSATIAVGATTTLSKTVTITQQSTAPVDVFFLTDTTGSMGTAISSVRTGFAGIVSSISAIAPNTQFGVGDYKDVGDPYVFQIGQNLTSNNALVQSALNDLSAGGGGDTPEANLPALERSANNVSWRAGSQRFLLWTGDATGHDPRDGSTEASATAALVAEDIVVYAISVGSGALNATGQATRITAATGGSVLSGGYSEAADLIEEALTTSILNYSTVELTVEGLPSGVGVSFTPAAINGTFDRSTNRTFNFDVSFTGLAAGTYDFSIAARVDGAIVATEADRIVVTSGGDPVIPEPSTYMLLGSGIVAMALLRRRFMA